MPDAVILLSGGIDSTTTLAIAKNDGYNLYALSIKYGQRHDVEIKAAQKIAQVLEVAKHMVIDVDLRSIGGSALTDNLAVPKERTSAEISGEIPNTYVPARNTIFLSLALAWAEVLESEDIFIGVNALDYSGYPDCRAEYIKAFEQLANLATKAGVEGKSSIKIHTPLLDLTKVQIIQEGIKLGIDYSLTHSCYDPAPDELPCGQCDSCILRIKGFNEAGLTDPITYYNA